ncbi:MAG: hypothetical protein SGPRY_001381, partial [Prymnesium sp.]
VSQSRIAAGGGSDDTQPSSPATKAAKKQPSNRLGEAARLVSETKAKVESLREKVSGMKGKVYAEERSEMNREIRELESSDAYLDALKLVESHPEGAAALASASMMASAMPEKGSFEVKTSKFREAARLVSQTKVKVESLRDKVHEMKGKAYAEDRWELNREIRELESGDAYLDALKLVESHPEDVLTASSYEVNVGDTVAVQSPLPLNSLAAASDDEFMNANRLVLSTRVKAAGLRKQLGGMKGKAYAQERSDLNREIRDLEEADAYLDALKVVESHPERASLTDPRIPVKGMSGPELTNQVIAQNFKSAPLESTRRMRQIFMHERSSA